MGYAPRSLVATAPSPALSGATLTVAEDMGAVFNARQTVPFIALVWPVGEQPVLGVNAEQVQVVEIIGDSLVCIRSSEPIAIAEGMHVALIELIPHYERGDTVTLIGHFLANEPPYNVHVRNPIGEVDNYGSAEGVTHDGLGNTAYQFEPELSGMWGFRWESEAGMLDDNYIFVDYTDVL